MRLMGALATSAALPINIFNTPAGAVLRRELRETLEFLRRKVLTSR